MSKWQEEDSDNNKINITKKEKQLIFVWSLAYNLSGLGGPTRNMKVPADLACKIIETHKPPYHDKVLTTGEKAFERCVIFIPDFV